MAVAGLRKSGTEWVVPQVLRLADAVDYDEGTYTPVLDAATGADLSGTFSATYVRMGSTVTVSMYLDINSITGASGALSISLPYRVGQGNPPFRFLPMVYAATDPTNNDTGALVNMNGMFLRLSDGVDVGAVILWKNFGTAGVAGANVSGFQTFVITADSIPIGAIWYVSGSYVTDGVKLV